jgi:uncharacterized protein RhaS with RHS repeats
VANKHDGSGLVYMRNRYLNPQTGQFTQTDPIGLAGGLNLYGYAGGDPVNFQRSVRARMFAIKWRVDNLLPQRDCISYRVAALVLVLRGVEALACQGRFERLSSDEEGGVDFLEYTKQEGSRGIIRIVFTEGIEISITAFECELKYILD